MFCSNIYHSFYDKYITKWAVEWRELFLSSKTKSKWNPLVFWRSCSFSLPPLTAFASCSWVSCALVICAEAPTTCPWLWGTMKSYPDSTVIICLQALRKTRDAAQQHRCHSSENHLAVQVLSSTLHQVSAQIDPFFVIKLHPGTQPKV